MKSSVGLAKALYIDLLHYGVLPCTLKIDKDETLKPLFQTMICKLLYCSDATHSWGTIHRRTKYYMVVCLYYACVAI